MRFDRGLLSRSEVLFFVSFYFRSNHDPFLHWRRLFSGKGVSVFGGSFAVHSGNGRFHFYLFVSDGFFHNKSKIHLEIGFGY